MTPKQEDKSTKNMEDEYHDSSATKTTEGLNDATGSSRSKQKQEKQQKK